MRNEAFLEKPLPSSDESEKTILGSIILDDSGTKFEIANTKLKVMDFYGPLHRRIFDAMIALHQQARVINPITILEQWKTEGVDPNSIGGITVITNIDHGLAMVGHRGFLDAVETVKKHSIARQLLQLCNNAVSDILAEYEPIDSIVEQTETKVLSLSSSLAQETKDTEKPFSSLIEIVPDMRKQFIDYHNNITNGVRTGMKEVDDMLDGGGLQGGGLYLVAAMEKTGKTSLVLDWIYDISAVQGFRSLVATGEMSKITMAKRIYSSHTGIPYFKFRPGIYDSHTDPVYSNSLKGLDKFGKIPISISDKINTVAQAKRHFRREVENGHKSNDPSKKVKVIVVDYMQLFTMGTKDKYSRTEEVEAVSREFKLLATELDVPIIAISSMNRLGMDTSGKGSWVPDTINLRQSGTLSFDAEAIFFLHNPAYIPGQPYVPTEVTPMNLILARQRNGPSGPIPVVFIGPYMQFLTVKEFEKRMGPLKSDQELPKSNGQVQTEQEELSSLWPSERV